MADVVNKLKDLTLNEPQWTLENIEDMSGFTIENLYKDATKFYKGNFLNFVLTF